MSTSSLYHRALTVLVGTLAWISGGSHVTARVLSAQATPATPLMALDRGDPTLQAGLVRSLQALGLAPLIQERRLAVALADLTEPGVARYAGVNDDAMMYAASLPKIAVLLTVFEKIEARELPDTPELRETLTDMIRFSSNAAATRAIHLVGFDAIAGCLEQSRYRLYDRSGFGGLWVGKAYDRAPAVTGDPLLGMSHGATARQAVRFFVLLDQGLLVSPKRSREMLRILGNPEMHHKFVKGLEARPAARIYRKSGTWRHWHSDAALIERNGQRYVVAALVEDRNGSEILERLIVALDDLVEASIPNPH